MQPQRWPRVGAHLGAGAYHLLLSAVSGSAASAPLGSLLEMQNLGPLPKPVESESSPS